MPPRVSILLPAYEPDPAHLRAALDCAMAQTVSDWELLVHDDASTVDVRAMIEPHLNDPRITFVKSDVRRGIGGNWNACLAQAHQEFVQFLFQDDLWSPRYLEQALKQMEDTRVGFVAMHHTYRFDGPIQPERKSIYQELERVRLGALHDGWNDREEFLRRWIERGLRPNLVGEPSFVLLRRELTKRAGHFRKDMPQGLDTEYWLRCLLHGDIAFSAKNGGQFRVHAKGASAQNDAEGHGLYDRMAYFETLLRHLPRGELKQRAQRSLSEQFAHMIQKFFARKKEGGSVGSGGAAVLLRMAMRHPVLLLQGVFGSWFLSSSQK